MSVSGRSVGRGSKEVGDGGDERDSPILSEEIVCCK
jgi:hypothetical protein